MWCKRVLAGTVLALAAVTVPAAAQGPGSVEIGALGRYSFYDKYDSNLDRAFGGSGMLGVYFHRLVMLEAGAAYSPTETIRPSPSDVTHLPLFGRLVLNVPVAERLGILLGGGYQRTQYLVDGVDPSADNGVQGLIGFQAWLSGGLALRAQGIADFVPSPKTLSPVADPDANYTHWAAELGLTYTFGKAPRDTDRDGVADGRDRCANTPMGVRVDAAGCPVDTDRDGVADHVDRCPNTPAGARVDATGCPTDADGDKVFDGLDRCPNTPAGATVDASGCPTDADKDGVFDGLDRCPNTPAGAAVDANGCPVDTDADGVIDLNDRCPSTPTGARVDTNGCPTDSDKDGVFDGLDRCPNTEAGRQVDANGCPILFEADKPTLVLQGVTFATGSAVLSDNSQTVLDIVAESLKGNPDVRVEVGGHTDATGSRALNTRLSQARAESVRTYLISQGVPATQLTARGYGPDNPVATNSTAAGRARNRRVELKKIN